MKFKDYQDYTNKRTVLLDDAKKLLDSGDIEGFNAKTKEIENMDKAYEEFANSQAILMRFKILLCRKYSFQILQILQHLIHKILKKIR